MDETLLQRILRINTLEDVLECFASSPEFPFPTRRATKFVNLLLAQCMNCDLQIPKEIRDRSNSESKIFCFTYCLENDNLEYFKYFISLGWEKQYMIAVNTGKTLRNFPKILEYCSNDPGFYELNPYCIRTAESVKDTFSYHKIYGMVKCEFIARSLPYTETRNALVVKYRDLIDFTINANIGEMRLGDLPTLRYLFDDDEVFLFLREGEYELVFNKLTEIFLLCGKIEYEFDVCDFFRTNLRLLTPSQEDFLIREHLDFLKSRTKEVIMSGRKRLIEALKE